MRHLSLLLLIATACSTAGDDSARAHVSRPEAPRWRWDGTYIGAFYQRDWRCPQLRDDEAMTVEHGVLTMPWHIHGAEDGSWAGFDVGQFHGTVRDDGTALVAATVTARTLPAAMIATGYTASSSRGGIAALNAAVPQILFRVDDDGRHATLVLSADCILDLGVVGERPRRPAMDAAENAYPFAGVHLTQRAAADQFSDLDRSPGVAYSYSTRVRTVFDIAPAHRVIRCIQRTCGTDPADPGWVAYGWYDAPGPRDASGTPTAPEVVIVKRAP
jgi:hypothetical protein